MKDGTRVGFWKQQKRSERPIPKGRVVGRTVRVQQMEPRGWEVDGQDLIHLPLSDHILSVPVIDSYATAAEAERAIRDADAKFSEEANANIVTTIDWNTINALGTAVVKAVTGHATTI